MPRYVLRYYSVFNSEQFDLPASVTEKLALSVEKPIDPIDTCEQIVANMPNPPQIEHTGGCAFYSPPTDCITLPPRGFFESAEAYHACKFHEICTVTSVLVR
jgi:antirestriction protein ArdC